LAKMLNLDYCFFQTSSSPIILLFPRSSEIAQKDGERG
jgi:hypothetical protein